MSEKLQKLIDEMEPRLPPLELDAPIRLDITDHGSIRIENNTATISDIDASCIISASYETLKGVLEHKIYPATAMTMGRIKVKGEFGQAIKFSYIYNR